MMKPVTAVILGAGSRGCSYAEYAKEYPQQLQIVAIAEPREDRRNLLAQELKARVQETHEPAPQLTFEHAVTQALDKMRTLKGNAWNLAIYPNSTSWCKIQLFGKTKFTCQANQRAVVLISQKRVTEEVLNKYAHKVGKQNQFDFRPETPEELKALLIDLMTCNC